MKKYIFIALCMMRILVDAQCPSVRMLEKENFSLDSLRKNIGKNMTILPLYELPTLIALSYYPDLHDKKIIFVYENIKTSMQARPKLFSLFKKGKRTYIISINNRPNGKGVLLKDAPFNAQVGVIGHELSHITDYEQENLGGMILWGIRYLSSKGKIKAEHKTDFLTIKRGLGWQLYDWAYYVLEQSSATPEYKAFKEKTYMKPQDILAHLEH